MFPDWPKSDADLVPLPLCEGPKLKAFDLKGPQDIEFLEYLGSGAHSCVFKVKIHAEIYALKVFRFANKDGYMVDIGDIPSDDNDSWDVFYQSSDPFSAECRAFGRLQETGNEHLAVKCFGYVLLDEEHERIVKDKFSDKCVDWDYMGSGLKNWYHRHPGTEDNPSRTPPLRCIVKEFGPGIDPKTTNFNDVILRRYLRDIQQCQQLGIVGLDPGPRQLIGGRQCDLSYAITTPHFAISPEMHPTLSPEMLSHFEYTAFWYCIRDYWAFDTEVLIANEHWENEEYRGEKRFILWTYAFPQQADQGYDECCKLHDPEREDRGRPLRYNLRSKPHRDRLWTYVDPRKHDWRQSRKIRLSGPPQRWYLDRDDFPAMEFHASQGLGAHISPFIRWWFRKGAFVPTLIEDAFWSLDAPPPPY